VRPWLVARGRRIVEQSLELYTCSGAAGADSETPAEARNGTLPRSYNELATLMSVTGAQSAYAMRGARTQAGVQAL